jgi:serine/threonine protein kinase
VGQTLGAGTFGRVKAGTHIPTGEPVAIKILEKAKIKEVADAQRVAREIKILKRVRHPNIVQLYEVIDTPKQILLVMERLDSGELFEYICRHSRLREDVAVRFMHDIVEGLSALHRREVAHRDLKPENILMDRREGGYVLKLIDFGLSNCFDGGRLLKTACGSPCYAAPELLRHQPYRGELADVW